MYQLAIIFLTWLSLSTGTLFQGELPTAEEQDFRLFVGKFAYDFREEIGQDVGEAILKIKRLGPPIARSDTGRLYFVLYDDERSHWRRVKRDWASRTCKDLKEAASLSTEIDLAAPDKEVDVKISIREHIRTRFWYFAFVGCDLGKTELPVHFQVHALNSKWTWQQEFSMDHMGLLVVYLVFVVAIPAALLCTVVASSSDDGVPRRDHPYVRLLLLSYGLFWASCVFFLLHYGFFAHDGMGSRRIRFLAVLSCIIANCTIFVIVLLASTGFAISTAIMPNKRVYLGAVALVGGLNGYLELHAETATDLSSKLYGLQSTPGLMSLVVKMFMTCWFAFSIRGTHEAERDVRRRNFYKVLGVSYTVWLLHVPVTVLVCFMLAPYVRYKGLPIR